MTYGETIRQARERAGMTQEELAERLNVSRQAVSKWEKGLSRPTSSKLAALAEIFALPADVWTEIDRAEQKQAEVLRQSDSEVKLLHCIKRWKRRTALLAGLLCLSVFCNIVQLAVPRTPPLPMDTAEAPPQEAADSAAVFPKMLELAQRRSYDVGDCPLGAYDPTAVPELKELNAYGHADNTLWDGVLEDENGVAAFLQVIRTNPVSENNTTFWDVYLVYAVPDAAGRSDWKILYRMADGSGFVDGGSLTAEPFANVLGYNGFKLSLVVGADGTYVAYITQRADGTPCLMLSTGTSGASTMEFDVDEDGVKEIVIPIGQPARWEIYDRPDGQDWTDIYTLDSRSCTVSAIGFDPKQGGFAVGDGQGRTVVRYVLHGSVLTRRPATTDVTAADYPDAAATELVFDPAYFNDSIDPDTLQETDSGIRITPRQQAYLALQQLYDLTGQRFDRLYCAVDGRFGMTCFSLLEGGLVASELPRGHGAAEVSGRGAGGGAVVVL